MIREEDFEGEVYSAYEQLLSVWLQSKESKVPIYIYLYINRYTSDDVIVR